MQDSLLDNLVIYKSTRLFHSDILLLNPLTLQPHKFSDSKVFLNENGFLQGETDWKFFLASWDDQKTLNFRKKIINAYQKWFLNSSSFNFYFKFIIKFIFLTSMLFLVCNKNFFIMKPLHGGSENFFFENSTW